MAQQMTDAQVPVTWPVPEIVIWPRTDGETTSWFGEVNVAGQIERFENTDREVVRNMAVNRVGAEAARLTRPVRAATLLIREDYRGDDWPMIVNTDGTVTQDASRQAVVIDRTRLTEEQAAALVRPPKNSSITAPVQAETDPAEQSDENTSGDETTTPEPSGPTLVMETGMEPGAGDPGYSHHNSNPGFVGGPGPVGTAGMGQPTDSPGNYPGADSFSFLEPVKRVQPATEGWRGFLNRLGLKLKPSQAESKWRADVLAVSHHWPGPRTIAVVNGKGGAGKTPTTILLSAVFARFGGAGVLSWDNNQTRGTLGWRTEQSGHQATVRDVLAASDRLLSVEAQSADMAWFVHHQTADRFDVLRSTPTELRSDLRLGPVDVDRAWQVAAKFYRLIVIDSGNDESDAVWLRMIDHADQVVIPTTTRPEHAEAAALLVGSLRARDARSAALADKAVAVVLNADPRHGDPSRITDGLRGLGLTATTVGFDQAMIDGPLAWDSLADRTQREWVRAAALVAERL